MAWWTKLGIAVVLFAALEVLTPGSVVPRLRQPLDESERARLRPRIYQTRLLLAAVSVAMFAAFFPGRPAMYVLGGLALVLLLAAIALSLPPVRDRLARARAV